MPTYRTIEARTDRILKDWILKERLAFKLEPSLSVLELQAILPPQCKEQLGEFKPTDNIFRKMSSGFNKVSDVWIELMRLIGVQDFSPEQAVFGTVSTFLDNENVRVKLNASYNTPHRKNSIEVFCLNEPTYQGLIRYEGDRLSFPPSIFEAVIARRIEVYTLYCENLSDLLLIPGVSDPQSLLIAENNARLAEEHRGLDGQLQLDELDGVSTEDTWMDSSEAELEAAQNEEITEDDDYDHNQVMAHLIDEETAGNPIVLKEGRAMLLDDAVAERITDMDGEDVVNRTDSEQMADVHEYNELIGSLMTDDAKSSDDSIALTLFDCDTDDDTDDEIESLPETVDDTDADAEIEAAVDGHGSEIDEVDDEDKDNSNEVDNNDLDPKIVVGASDIRDYDLDN